MAQQGVRIDQDKYSCSICSEPLKEPVTIPCGHTYCQICIVKHWDYEKMTTKQLSVSCPICRRTFSRRPTLKRNTVLADLVEELKKTKDVASGMGTLTKQTVSKFPVADSHDQPPKKQRLLDSRGSKQDYMCSQHNEEKKIFCRTEQQFICYLCLLSKHKGHDAVSVEEEIRHRRKQMEAERQRTEHVIQGIEKDIVLLHQKLQDLDKTADQLVSENEKMSSEVMALIKNMSSELTDKIRQQQFSESLKIQELLMLKERDKDVQKKRLESINRVKLLHTDSYKKFLEKCPTSSKCGELSSRINLPILHDFQNVTKVLSQEIHKLNDTWAQVFTPLGQKMVLGNPQCPKTNEEFCNYSVLLMLDPDTVNENLTLSENKTKVTCVKEAQPYPPFLDRFRSKAQVLTADPLPDRCYWEVEWSGLGVSVGVAYNDIKRDGPDSGFGNNDKSWVLDCSTTEGYVYRRRQGRRTLFVCESSRVGVFLDHKAGTLCFYQVSQTNKLIHKVQTRFTQPLYAGLGVYYYGATAEMCVKERSINPEPPDTAKYNPLCQALFINPGT